jgi:hypothetical protein
MTNGCAVQYSSLVPFYQRHEDMELKMLAMMHSLSVTSLPSHFKNDALVSKRCVPQPFQLPVNATTDMGIQEQLP